MTVAAAARLPAEAIFPIESDPLGQHVGQESSQLPDILT